MAQTARRPHQTGQQQQGTGELLPPGKGGGEPVELLAQDQVPVCAHRQLHVGAPHVHAQQQLAPGPGGQLVKDGPERGGAGRLRHGGLLLDVKQTDPEPLPPLKQGVQNPLVYVEALAVAGARPLLQPGLEHPVQASGQLRPPCGVPIELHLHRPQGGEDIVNMGVEILRRKVRLRLSPGPGQGQGEDPDRAVVEGHVDVEGQGPLALKGRPHVGEKHRLSGSRLAQKSLHHNSSLLCPPILP